MDYAFNLAEKHNNAVAEKSPNFQPAKGYFDDKPDRFNDFWMEHDPEYRRRFVESIVKNVLKEESVKKILKEGIVRTEQQNMIRKLNITLRDAEDEITAFEHNNPSANYQIPVLYKKIHTLFDNLSDCLREL